MKPVAHCLAIGVLAIFLTTIAYSQDADQSAQKTISETLSNWTYLAWATVGGLLPDLIRILKWARTPKNSREANPLFDGATYVSAVIQVILGWITVAILLPGSAVQSVAFGYFAPDVLIRTLAAAQGKTDEKEVVAHSPKNVFRRALAWWKT